jgi:protein-disulfide isomerase
MARPPAPPPTPRAAFAASLALALAGLVVSLMLVRVHHDAAIGVTSFCTISEEINCDKVALSAWSVLFGVPVAAWGAAGYALFAALSIWGLQGSRLHSHWPAGLLWALGVVATAVTVALALISKFVIGAWCLLCMGSWAASVGLLITGWLACRRVGVAAAVRTDLKSVGRYPRRAAVALVLGLFGVLLLSAAYPRELARARRAEDTPAAAANQLVMPRLPPATGPALLFSDYECPYCSLAHQELRELLRVRPDIKVVKRHFPLDQACNPIMKRPLHEHACELARAAICAEAQGQFDAMDDALFASQKAPAPVEELAARLKLDVPRFKACLAAPQTAARLAADIEAGIKLKLRSTPTYVVDGTLHEGKLPLERFPPPVPPPPVRE